MRFYILGRQWSERTYFYVAQKRGEGNPKSDWGYVTESTKAVPMSTYWMRRFVADCRRAGAVANVREVFV